MKEVIKLSIFFLLIVSLFINISSVNLEVRSSPINTTIITDLDESAVFELEIKNNGQPSTFEIYTFQEFNIDPELFFLEKGEEKRITLNLKPYGKTKENEGHLAIRYYIREKSGPNEGAYNGNLVVKLVKWNRAFVLGADNIGLDSSFISIQLYNLEDRAYEDIEITLSSEFFDLERQVISLKPYEKKTIVIPLNSEKLKNLVAGEHKIRAEINYKGITATFIKDIQIFEKSGIIHEEGKSGLVIRERNIKKRNVGNVISVAEIVVKKDIISRLFTSFSLEPQKIERKGIFVEYFWQKELMPNDSLEVKVRTNWTMPILIFLFITITIIISARVTKKDLIVKKRIVFIKTKSNDFALKIILRLRANKYVERITIYDRLPVIVKIYEKFDQQPSKLDKDNGKIQWEIPRLMEGEEREISYIIYSKIKVIGKFELPPAAVFYERNGVQFNERSNRVFFINGEDQNKKGEKV
ncbi:MAG: hypothetical protein QXJ28_01725 [Candidatus Pacearchaeota archaeon]